MVSGKPGLREMERVVVPWLFHEAQHNLPAAGGRGEAMARSVALSGDGRLAVSASDDQTLEVWDLASGSELRISTGHSSVVTAVAVTADGLRAVSASYDGTLKAVGSGDGQCPGHLYPRQRSVLLRILRRACHRRRPARRAAQGFASAPSQRSLIEIPQPSSLQFPVPLTGTEPLVPGAATLTLMVALFVPVEDGLNVTLIWQVACAAKVPEQVELWITN